MRFSETGFKRRSGGNEAAIVEQILWQEALSDEAAPQDVVLRFFYTEGPRLSFSGSSCVVAPVEGYKIYLPRVGTSPSVVDTRGFEGDVGGGAEHTRSREPLTLTAADQAREVLAALSLNRSQLAEVLRVSRPTLYDWLDGREPNAANAERLLVLSRLLARAGIGSSDPLPPRFVRQPLRDGGVSLLELIGAEVIDAERALTLLGEARTLVVEMDRRRSEREEHLRKLGFEEPSEERRKVQLATSMATRDWPKT